MDYFKDNRAVYSKLWSMWDTQIQ